MKIGTFFSDFIRDIGNFFRAGTVMGIDIGTSSIKVAELGRKKERFALLNYGIVESKEYLIHPNRAIQTSSLKIVEKDTTALLNSLLFEVKPKAKIAIASIPAFAAFMTVLDMPLISKEETAKAIMFQAAQYIPLPLKDVEIDWMKVDEFDTQERQRYQRILLIAIPQTIINAYKTIFHDAGLHLVALEVDGLALARALFSSTAPPTLLIDLGAEATNMFVITNGILQYAGETDYGGIYLTQAIGRSLGITLLRAEELKRRKGLLKGGAESELSTLTLPYLDVILQEVNHVRETYERRYSKKIERIMLVGGAANLLGIEKYFSAETGLPSAAPNLFRAMEYDLRLEPILRELQNELPVAVGLAERYFV